MATSPGRSAIQPKPAAMTAIEIRKRMIRIIPTSLLPKRVRAVARDLTRRRKRSLPCLSLGNPPLSGRPRCRVEFPEISECIIDGRACGLFLDARQYGGSIVTGRRIDRPDPHELGGTRLKTLQVTAGWRLTARSLHQGWKQRA